MSVLKELTDVSRSVTITWVPIPVVAIKDTVLMTMATHVMVGNDYPDKLEICA